jgi:hypothetical protein
MSRTRIIIPFTAAERLKAPYAILIQPLPDLKAATEWLTNSDSIWQAVSSLLNIFLTSLFFHAYHQSGFLNHYIKKTSQMIHVNQQCHRPESLHGIYRALSDWAYH